MLRKLLPALAALVLGAGAVWAQAIPLPVLLQGNVPGWVTRAGGVPAGVDLDFANGRWYQQGQPGCTSSVGCLATSRASVAYEDDLSGNWIAFAANTPRVTNKGLLVEEARTNSTRNSTMQGAVAGSPGTLPTNWIFGNLRGLTQQVVQIGSQQGIDYIRLRLSGTPTSTGAVYLPSESAAHIAASNGQTWTGSIFLAMSGGSQTNISSINLRWDEYTSAPAFIQADISSNLTVTSIFTRQSFSFTLSGGAAVASILGVGALINVTSGQSIDITLDIGWPQTELGAFPTSPIPTISAALIRAADVVTLARSPAFGSALTAVVAANPSAPNAYASNQQLLAVTDGTLNNRGFIYRASGTGAINAGASSAGVGSPGVGVGSNWNQGVAGKVAMSLGSGQQTMAFNGGAPASAATTYPVGLNAVAIGQRGDTALQWDGYITRLALWPTQALPAAQLQALTR